VGSGASEQAGLIDSMAKKVRYGVIGAGHAAQVLHLPHLRRDSRVEVVWCADIQPEVAERTAARFGVPHAGADYERLLDERPVDAVSLCIPHNAHYGAAMAAIRRGVHVCCEKPLGMNLAEAEALSDAAEAAGVRGMVAYSYRFNPNARLLKELIDTGELGRVVQVHGCYAQGFGLSGAPMGWRFQKAAAGSGALADLCSHLLHLALWWVGDLQRVCAHFKTVVGERTRPGGEREPVDVEDVCALMGEFASGAVCQFTASRVLYGHKNDQRVEVSGTHGAAIYENRASHVRVCVGRSVAESAAWELATPPQRLLGRALQRSSRALWVRVAPPSRCHVSQMAHFIDAVLDGRPIETDFREGARIHAVMEAVQRSSASGAWVEVGEVGQAIAN
jgi:predicted dehydrogenase